MTTKRRHQEQTGDLSREGIKGEPISDYDSDPNVQGSRSQLPVTYIVMAVLCFVVLIAPHFTHANIKAQLRGTPGGSKGQIRDTVGESWGESSDTSDSLGIETGRAQPGNDDCTHRDEAPAYHKSNITNSEDFKIRDELDEADSLFRENHIEASRNMFSAILKSHPKSPRALWGLALTHEISAKVEHSKYHGNQVIPALNMVIKNPDVPSGLLGLVIPKVVRQYLGQGKPVQNLAKIWRYLSHQRPNDLENRRLFAIELDHFTRARSVAENAFKELLETNPDDCLSMAYLGRYYNLRHNNYEKSAELLQRAITMDCPGVRTFKLYYKLGDSYMKLGYTEKANVIHNLGAARGLFQSRDQRSNNNADTPLTARPWWTVEETTYHKHLKVLEENWEMIRDEAMAVLDANTGEFRHDSQGIVDDGVWRKLALYHNGARNDDACKKTPRTCALVDTMPECTTLTRGQVKFSVIHPGSHLWAHCGPTNCRIRAHLGLVVPEGPRLRVGNDTRTWHEGKFIVFDDSFEHEVWHDGTSGFRLVLIVDLWHPDLTLEQRKTIASVEQL